MRVLLVDIGNSRVKWRIVDPRADRPQCVAPQRDAPVEDASACGESLALADLRRLKERFVANEEPTLDAVHVSNVAGAEAEDVLRGAVRATWGDVTVHALIPSVAQCGVRNDYRDKAQLGPDRWAAMLGARALLTGSDLLVCSFGTASTIDLLVCEDDATTNASFAGGLILPGIEAMRRALARDTARLPLVQGEVVDFARGTDDAIASGIAAAQTGAVMRALRDARARVASRNREHADSSTERPFACVLAGGGANAMAACLSDLEATVYVVSDLVLRGLHAIARDAMEGSELDGDSGHRASRVHRRARPSGIARERP